MTRDQAKEKVKTLGGIVASSISKKVNYVVAGQEAGSKLKKAIELKVSIINESEFLKDF